MSHTKLFKTRVTGLLVGLIFLMSATAAAQPAEPQATINSSDPAQPVLEVKNDGEVPCQVAQTALGTIAINRVSQDGKDVEPTSFTPQLDNPKEHLQQNLRRLEPGDTVSIPLRITALSEGGYALESIDWLPAEGAYGLTYRIDRSQPLAIELSYDTPVAPESGAPVCPPTTATNKRSFPWWILVIIAMALFIALAFTTRRGYGKLAGRKKTSRPSRRKRP